MSKPLAPGTVQMWFGNWRDNRDGIKRISESLDQGDNAFQSPYAELSRQGPTITDRRLFFVEEIQSNIMFQAPNTTRVVPRLGSQDKKLYEGLLRRLEGVISNDHLFDVYLGECIAPYVALDPLKAVLPVHRPSMTMPLSHDAGQMDTGQLHPTMQRRWDTIADMFQHEHQGRGITDLLANLNHLNKLTRQLEYLRRAIAGDGTVRVAYTASGQPIAAIVEDNYAILESNVYQTACDSRGEAHYLLAIINSYALRTAAESSMPRGDWGPRHFQKHGWKLPIPRYDAEDPLHTKLSELGAVAEQECVDTVADSDILAQPAGSTQSKAARTLLRHTWQPNSQTAQDIEKAVTELLNDADQALKAYEQMRNANQEQQ